MIISLLLFITVLSCRQVCAISLPDNIQGTVFEVALRLGRSGSIADQVALVSLPKSELLSNLTDLLYVLRLDRINSDIKHHEFNEKHESAISTINDTMTELKAALAIHEENLQQLANNLQDISNSLKERESVLDQSEAILRHHISMVGHLAYTNTEQQKGNEIRIERYRRVLEMINEALEKDSINDVITDLHSLENGDEFISDCMETVAGNTNMTQGLILVRGKIRHRLDLVASASTRQQTRFNLTIDEYHIAVREHERTYEAIDQQIGELQDERWKLSEQRGRIRNEADLIEKEMEELQSTMKVLLIGLMTEDMKYRMKIKSLNADLDDLNTAVMIVNSKMDGDLWPGLCPIGTIDCRRCLYNEHCLEQGQICSQDGLCIDDSVQI